MSVTFYLLAEQPSEIWRQIFADEGAVLTPPPMPERILFFAEYVTLLAVVSLILHFIFLKPFGKRAAPAAALLTACFAGVAFGLFPFLAMFDQEAAGTADLISTALLIAAAYGLFRGRKSLWEFIFIMIYTSWPELVCALAAPYIGTDAIAGHIICIALNAAVGIAVYAYSRTHEVNVLPQVFYTVPKWIYAVLFVFGASVYFNVFIDNELFLKIFNTSAVAFTFAGILYLIFKIFMLNYRQNEMLRRFEEQKSYGDSVKGGDTELRRFRHDYKNQMIVVNALLAAGRTDDAREHLNNMNSAISGELTRIRTGNFVADAIINNKATSAKAENVDIVFTGAFPEDGIRSDDLCTILANLLDNAVEATRLAGNGKTIVIKAGSDGGRFWFTVTNPLPPGRGDGLKTTKEDVKNHGFGIRNVRRALKEYNGDLITEAADGQFRAKVMMDLK